MNKKRQIKLKIRKERRKAARQRELEQARVRRRAERYALQTITRVDGHPEIPTWLLPGFEP